MSAVPERFRKSCEFCNREVDIREIGTHQYTKGWVRNRAGGGGHGVSLPVREARWAHDRCVKDAKAPQQPSFFDAPANMPIETPDVDWPLPIEDNGTNAGFEENGMFVHVCNVCGGRAPYGIGVSLSRGLTGLWYCGEHKPVEVELG